MNLPKKGVLKYQPSAGRIRCLLSLSPPPPPTPPSLSLSSAYLGPGLNLTILFSPDTIKWVFITTFYEH